MQVAILGRQPKLSLAELEALYGAKKLRTVSDYAVLVDTKKPLPQVQLGGTMKSATLLRRLENTELTDAFAFLQTFLPEHFMYLPKGKLQLGISVYGFKAQRDWLLKRMLTLKKTIKNTGQSVRIIENKSEVLESAQILYNKLTSELGCELLLIKDGSDIVVAQTTAVQDIDDYAKRDFGRPLRDAFVGMLPPKLAQIMINLAVGGDYIDPKSETSKIQDHSSEVCVLDPFCGTGVVLQEALLMGYAAYGTDLSEKMVDYSIGNLEWLETEFGSTARHSHGGGNPVRIGSADNSAHNNLGSLVKPENDKPNLDWEVKQADATTNKWEISKIQDLSSQVYIVCETYLGKPLTSLPQTAKLEDIIAEANSIAEAFLKNLAGQLKKGTRLCVALPGWNIGRNSFLHLKMLDHLSDLGYNRLEFVHAKKSELIYHREDQIVARELTILEKN